MSLIHDQGKYEEAQAIYQESISIRENSLGRDHPDVAKSLHELAQLYKTIGKFNQSELCLKRALSIQGTIKMLHFPK